MAYLCCSVQDGCTSQAYSLLAELSLPGFVLMSSHGAWLSVDVAGGVIQLYACISVHCSPPPVSSCCFSAALTTFCPF